jgi:hypothetical protein
MKRRQANTALLAAGAMAAVPAGVLAQPLRALPAPRKTIGKPLMQALQSRHSTRDYVTRPLSDQVLSDVLWAAYGINRPSGERTAPYWRHMMVIDVYTAMADGLWLYEPKEHALRKRLDADLRAHTGQQDFVVTAPFAQTVGYPRE